MRARYYSPSVGRFITEDSARSTQIKLLNKQEVDDPLSLNLYTYIHNDPINLIDPSGHQPAKSEAEEMKDIIGYIKDLEKNNKDKSPAEILIMVTEKFKKDDFNVRYVYTKEYGWIDMKHFFTAGEMANRWQFQAGDVVLLGIGNELAQLKKESDSAFSYEELPSNSAGALFGDGFLDNGYTTLEDIFGSDRGPRKCSEQFESYFKGLSPIDDPKKAPSWKDMPKVDLGLSKFLKPTIYLNMTLLSSSHGTTSTVLAASFISIFHPLYFPLTFAVHLGKYP